MKATLFSAVLSAWLCGSLATGAAGEERGAPDAPPGPRHGELLNRAFDHLDANGDGQIDKTEFLQQFPELVRRVRERQRSERARESRPEFRPGHHRPPPPGERGFDRPGDRREARRPGPPPAFGAQPPLGGPRGLRPEKAARPDRPDRPEKKGRSFRKRGGSRRGGGSRAGGQRGGGMMLFGLFDTNRDHTLDATEIQNASLALAKLDGNGDGKITPAELREVGKQMHGQRSGKGRPHKKGARQGKRPHKRPRQGPDDSPTPSDP